MKTETEQPAEADRAEKSWLRPFFSIENLLIFALFHIAFAGARIYITRQHLLEYGFAETGIWNLGFRVYLPTLHSLIFVTLSFLLVWVVSSIPVFIRRTKFTVHVSRVLKAGFLASIILLTVNIVS